MKEEIKEILEALKPQDKEFIKAGIKEYPLVLSVKEQKILLDYITNLQEENKQLKEKNYLLIDYQDMEIRYNEYKQRNEKAIEILKLCNSKCAKETINILKGDKDE